MTASENISALWFLPTYGDGHYLGSPESARAGDLPYLKQIAVDTLGFEGALLPTSRACEDSWMLASALAPLMQRLRFLVAIRPGVLSPTQAARMTARLDRLSNGRLLVNVVSGGDPKENGGDGLFWSHAERYRATGEFLNVYTRILSGEAVTFSGEFIRVEDARIDEYRRIGVDTLIFSGYPHLEEAYRVAELLLSRLPLKHPVANLVNTGPFGDTLLDAKAFSAPVAL